jgi:hypothetical protein
LLQWSVLASHYLLLVTADYEVIPTGSVWKYSDSGEDLISAGYQALTYSEDNFKSGTAPIGYGTTTFPTIASFGPDPAAKFITTYFRKAFNVFDDLSTTADLTVSVNYAHGVRCYLNGVEVFRKNMPVTTLTSLSTANSALSKPTVLAQYSVIPVFSKLKLGLNVIACDVHLFSPASSMMRFDLRLVAAGVPAPSSSPSFSPSPSLSSARTPSQSTGASVIAPRSPSSSVTPSPCSCDCGTLNCCSASQVDSCMLGREGSPTRNASNSSSKGSNGGAVAAGILVPLIVLGVGYGFYRRRRHRHTLATQKIDWKTSVGAVACPSIERNAVLDEDPPLAIGSNSPKLSRADLIKELSTIRLDGSGGVSTQRLATPHVPQHSSKKKKKSGNRKMRES